MNRLVLLDQNFVSQEIIDKWTSLIWVDRFWEAGDFELYLPATKENFQTFKEDWYLWSVDSPEVMIIESALIETDVESGSFLTITGRSLASLLERRIIWDQTTHDGLLWTAVQKYLNENAINPTDASRRIPNLIFQTPTDPAITSIPFTGQVTGENLYTQIQAMCQANDIGFTIRLNDSNQFVFSLLAGADRSYDQTTNNYVVFSPKFDNLISTNVLKSKKTERNVLKVAGEGEGLERRSVTVGSASGLARRELFVDARDISSNDGEIGTTEYNKLLNQRGEEYKADNKATDTFECTIDPNRSFHYGIDYFTGDIVSVFDDFGNEDVARMLELVFTTDLTGTTTIPTFAVVEDE